MEAKVPGDAAFFPEVIGLRSVHHTYPLGRSLNPFTARIIIMDSKFDDQECKEILTIAANTVHSHFRIAMREALAMAGKQRELQELRLVW
ncbi:hypothetical protein KIN20_019843 [Parelaphostrongylus tenuis]|uniref:Uncharacterized protein n=1 Tax=Parelaphostrongylus tenuis TaxID=148309 RepID=A0AAD5MS45_PARTN|nr:hypothetical protein KIN20_019843 [Parelaphostrongylus tenuis]